MPNKFLLTGKFILAILILICQVPSHADETNQSIRHVHLTWTVIEEEDDGRYQVLLTWTEIEYVLHYEIAVEREYNRIYTELHRESTKRTSVVLSLLPGSYRYRMRPIDLLNHPGEWTEWLSFEVVPPPPPITFFFGPSWATSIPLYGDLVKYFGFNLFPPGPRIGFDMIPFEIGSFNGGMELAASWFYLNNFFDEHNITVHMIILDFNLLMQKQFPNQRMILSFRLGMGLTILADKESQKGAVDLNPLTGQVNTGISCFWLIKGSSYIETGIDFSHLIGWTAGSLRPWIGFGIRF